MPVRFLLLAAWLAWPAAAQDDPAAAQPSPKPTLESIFKTAFNEKALADFGESPSAEALARGMSDEQKTGSRSKLDELARDPKNFQIAARGYLLLGSPRDALALSERRLKDEPSDPAALESSAQAKLALGDRAGAAEDARKALARDPGSEWARTYALLAVDKHVGAGFKVPKNPFDGADEGGRGTSRPAVVVRASARAAFASTPLPAAPEASSGGKNWSSVLKTTGYMVLGATGSLLLAGGLLAGPLEKQWPNIRKDMGIAAAGAAVLAVGFEAAGYLAAATGPPLSAPTSVVAPQLAFAGAGGAGTAGGAIALEQAGAATAGAGISVVGAKTASDYYTYAKGTKDTTSSRGEPEAKRVKNPSKSESRFWKELENYRDGIKRSGQGSRTRYYKWDNLHNDIEIYDSKGRHLGSLDPETGNRYKPAVAGRTIAPEL